MVGVSTNHLMAKLAQVLRLNLGFLTLNNNAISWQDDVNFEAQK